MRQSLRLGAEEELNQLTDEPNPLISDTAEEALDYIRQGKTVPRSLIMGENISFGGLTEQHDGSFTLELQ